MKLPRAWLWCLTIAFLAGEATESISAAERPNILLIVSDDQGFGDSSGFWKTDLKTPTIDGIGQDGAKLMRFRVNPLCAPTRASLMTGLYSNVAGMWRRTGATRARPQARNWLAR